MATLATLKTPHFRFYNLLVSFFSLASINSSIYLGILSFTLKFGQKKVSDNVKHIIIEAVESAYTASTPNSFGIADLGCSTGPNTLSFIKDMLAAIQGITLNHRIPQPPLSEVRVHLNDLPTNDFNSIFKSLPDFHTSLKNFIDINPLILIGAYPGSFYGRLFPNACLHFVHSSHCLHWLSKVTTIKPKRPDSPANTYK